MAAVQEGSLSQARRPSDPARERRAGCRDWLTVYGPLLEVKESPGRDPAKNR